MKNSLDLKRFHVRSVLSASLLCIPVVYMFCLFIYVFIYFDIYIYIYIYPNDIQYSYTSKLIHIM